MGIFSSLVSAQPITLAGTLNSITNIAQQYIVAPSAAFGAAGYVFNAQGDSIATLSADITDHYTESNQAIQDHIAIRPKRITLKGYVGELVYNSSTPTRQQLASLAQKLTVAASYLPTLSSGVQQAQNLFTAASDGSLTAASAITSTSNIYGLVQNVLGAFGDTANQQNAYTYFKSLMQSATLISVQTPWEFMQNMAIETIVAFQDEKSKYISDFSITFKEIRIATTQTTAFATGGIGGIPPVGGLTQQGDASLQAQNPVNLGTNPCATLPIAGLPGSQSTMTSASQFLTNPSLASFFSATGLN